MQHHWYVTQMKTSMLVVKGKSDCLKRWKYKHYPKVIMLNIINILVCGAFFEGNKLLLQDWCPSLSSK